MGGPIFFYSARVLQEAEPRTYKNSIQFIQKNKTLVIGRSKQQQSGHHGFRAGLHAAHLPHPRPSHGPGLEAPRTAGPGRAEAGHLASPRPGWLWPVRRFEESPRVHPILLF